MRVTEAELDELLQRHTSKPKRVVHREYLIPEVIQLAHLFGWRVAHFRAAQTLSGHWRTACAGDGAGFPDLVLLKPDRVIYAECKGPKTRVSVEQHLWIEGLRAAGQDVRIWRPSDWPEIEATLRGGQIGDIRAPKKDGPK